jgi:death-on-curing protein
MTRLLTLEAVLAIHQRQMAEHGGEPGVRDLGLLESALSRARNIISYAEDPDIASLAAAYAFGIAKNHPFLDGNKRTALVSMRTFLILNGSDINASQQDKYQTIMALADGSLTENELADWIRARQK